MTSKYVPMLPLDEIVFDGEDMPDRDLIYLSIRVGKGTFIKMKNEFELRYGVGFTKPPSADYKNILEEAKESGREVHLIDKIQELNYQNPQAMPKKFCIEAVIAISDWMSDMKKKEIE